MSTSFGYADPSDQLGSEAILIAPQRSIGPFEAHVTLREIHTDELEVTDQPVDQGASIADHAFKRPAELMIEAMWSNSPQESYTPPEPPQRNTLEETLTQALGSIVAPITNIVDGVSGLVDLAKGLIDPAPIVAPVAQEAELTGNGIDQVRDVYAKLLELQESRIPFDVYTGKRFYANMMLISLVQTTDAETENALHIQARLRQVLIAQVQILGVGAPRESQAQPESTAPVLDKGTKVLGQAPSFNPEAAAKAGVEAVVSKAGEMLVDQITGKLTSAVGGIF